MRIICRLCNKEINKSSLQNHVSQFHNVKTQDYFDIYLKKDMDGICLNCGLDTKFIGISQGYRIFCSRLCHGIQMKNILKNKKVWEFNYFCKICNKGTKTINGLSKHIRYVHNMSSESYYTKYIMKSEGESVCNVCGSPTTYRGLVLGYSDHCGNSCGSKDPKVQKKLKNTCIERYGYINHSKTRESRRKSRETMIKSIEIQRLNGEPLVPCIGSYERKCLDIIQKETTYIILRNPNIIGYFPDGYIPELNIIIEFDEPHHFISGELTYHDKLRQKELESYTMSRFFRIKQSEWLMDREVIISNFRNLIKDKQ